MTTRAFAEQLAVDTAATLTAAGLDVACVTAVTSAVTYLQAGRTVLVINPPTVRYPTWSEVDAAWELWLIAGPTDPTRLDVAWDRLDAARDVLVGPLELEDATPNAFDDGQGNRWPALVLRTTTHHDRDTI